MATITPRRSSRIPHVHTPKMSERKKGLFQVELDPRDSLTQHRRVPVVNSESDSDDCDLGIISALDSSSGDETQNENAPRTPTRNSWPYETRSHSKRRLKEANNLKNFIKSPFTLKQYQSKGVLVEQSTNIATTPIKLLDDLTKMDMGTNISPTQMLRTPQNTTEAKSPPKLSHRKIVVESDESPETKCDSEKSHKRLRNESIEGPVPKHPKLDSSTAPKARLSLFNSDRLKEILSTKSFYGKTSPNNSFTAITTPVVTNPAPRRHSYSHQRRRSRRPGQINLGVRHRIRKPILHKGKIVQLNRSGPIKPFERSLNNSTLSSNEVSMMNSSQEMDDKIDPFDREKQTIANLLSQWNEDEPEDELIKPELPCFNSTVIEETQVIFQPASAVPVDSQMVPDSGVILELGAKSDGSQAPAMAADVSMDPQSMQHDVEHNMQHSTEHAAEHNMQHSTEHAAEHNMQHSTEHGAAPSRQFLPVEGGYILVPEGEDQVEDEPDLDLDALERELKMLDEKILSMARHNHMDPSALLASTEASIESKVEVAPDSAIENEKPKLFPIFSNPNTGIDANAKSSPGQPKKPLLKSMSSQYAIDAGQARFGATQCAECGLIYEIGDPQDEHDHLVHHNATDVLKFNGWKDEVVVGGWESSRVILVRGAAGARWRRVRSLLARVVQPQLGAADLPREDYQYTAYLYIEKKQIVGCLVVEPKSAARRLLPGDPDCCSAEEYPVKCGVSRLWSSPALRRRGVASRLLDCARATFLYGAALSKDNVAFSAPTAAGKAFAAKYCGTDNFYVYLD